MIREISSSDFDEVFRVVNDAAQAYRGIIPDDRWKEPYMPREELEEEIDAGIEFYGWVENCDILGVMGVQRVMDVTLIRHAYVLTEHQRKGIGGRLLSHLVDLTESPVILIGTWEDADWAVHFYEKNGFELVSQREKERLLRKYWDIPDRQIETSVVLRLEK
ncbi:MAG: GNAT family N-acetyltransferase [Candidatus Bathyarchaeia archaeon]